MTQTIAQQIKWNFKTNGDLKIKDKNGNEIYYEHSSGFWSKSEYDSKGNIIYFEDSDGDWLKHEYDSQGNEIYYENSDGEIIDNRPKAEPSVLEVTTTKTYKVGDSVECLTYDGWMHGGITDIDFSKRVLSVYVEDYNEIHKFTTNQIK